MQKAEESDLSPFIQNFYEDYLTGGLEVTEVTPNEPGVITPFFLFYDSLSLFT